MLENHKAGLFSAAFGTIVSKTVSGIPMSATINSPQRLRPGKSKWPGFLRKNVTVKSAFDANPWIAPVSASTPLGTSTATHLRPFIAFKISSAAPSIGLDKPAPKIASTTSVASFSKSDENSSFGPPHNLA